jgi:hypothetical protein
MKSKYIFSLMLNPFTRIAGWQAFGIGLVFVLITGITGTFSNVAFDGVIDMHLVQKLTVAQSFQFLTIDLISVVAIMTLTGFIISKGFRIIDILGTLTLSRAPLIIFAIAGFFTISPDKNEILKNPYIIFQSVSFIIVSILSIPVLIWNIILMFNALKISCGIKGNKLGIAFTIAILVSEIISKILIYNIVKI